MMHSPCRASAGRRLRILPPAAAAARVVLLAGVVAAGLAAQGHVAVPGGIYLRTEAPHFASRFGADAAARYQLVDGNLRGAARITEVSFRLDFRQHTPLTAAGRSWTEVEVAAGDGDLASFGPSFAGNWQAAPTRVFRGPVTWPAAAGAPATCPAPWGGAQGALRFPFTAPFTSSGARDLLLEFTFRGGRLTGAPAPWTGSVPYLLDSYRAGVAADGSETRFGRYFLTGGCTDTRVNNTYGAFGMLSTSTFGPLAPVHPNHFAVSYKAHRLGIDAPVVTLLGLRLHRAGLAQLGTSCNRLHVDPAGIVAIFTGRADNVGTLPRMHFGLPNAGVFPYVEAVAGTALVAQSVWNDTRTGALKLAAASHNALLAATPFAAPAAVRRKSLWAGDAVSLSGTLRVGDPAFDPLSRLTIR